MAHILLMDDDTEFAFDCREELEKQGHHVTWKRNFQQAFDALNQDTVDLVITDIYIFTNGMVVEDGGISLISAMRISKARPDQKDLTKIPIIAISGAPNKLGNELILDTATTVGAHYNMVKPLDYVKLHKLIDTILTSTIDDRQ